MSTTTATSCRQASSRASRAASAPASSSCTKQRRGPKFESETTVMKKYVLGLLGLAFLNGAAALAQVPVPVGPPPPPPGAIGPDCCPPSRGCCAPHECVPQPYLKVTKKVVFTSGCEALCLPPCCGCCLFKGCSGCGGCGEGHCGH